MKQLFYLLFFSLLLASCGSSSSAKKYSYKKGSSYKTANIKKLTSNFNGKVSGSRLSIIKDADDYLGTPYKYAGNTRSGFDCSGLVCKVFDENNIKMPRRSVDQAKAGSSISVSNVKPGDLLFFSTSGSGNVNHVGIVREILSGGEITFIHSSTSKGVIISSLNEPYWNKAFLFARSVL